MSVNKEVADFCKKKLLREIREREKEIEEIKKVISSIGDGKDLRFEVCLSVKDPGWGGYFPTCRGYGSTIEKAIEDISLKGRCFISSIGGFGWGGSPVHAIFDNDNMGISFVEIPRKFWIDFIRNLREKLRPKAKRR